MYAPCWALRLQKALEIYSGETRKGGGLGQSLYLPEGPERLLPWDRAIPDPHIPSPLFVPGPGQGLW